MLRRCPRRRASIVILALVLLVVVFACVALAVDVGYLSLMRTRLQVAADAGAMAGTDALAEGALESATAAERFAELNFNSSDPLDVLAGEDIEFGTWDEESRVFQPLTADRFDEAFAVRVTCRRTTARGNGANLFFAHIFGRHVADVTAVAVARAKASTCGRIIGLDRVTMTGSCYTDSYNSANGAYSDHPPRHRGHVCSNGPILTSGTTVINGNGHPGLNSSIVGSGTITGTNTSLNEQLDFPPIDVGNADTINDNIRIPLTNSGATAVVNDELIINSGDTLEISAGLYHFTRMIISNGATLRTTGATVMYVDGDCLFSGGGLVNASQLPTNLQLYCSGSTCSISGTVDFYGVIYAPNTRIVRSGPSNIYGMLLGRELILSGTGGIHADEALGQLKGVRKRYTVLVD